MFFSYQCIAKTPVASFNLDLTSDNVNVTAYGKAEDLQTATITFISETRRDGKAAIIGHFYGFGKTFYIGIYFGARMRYSPANQLQNYQTVINHVLIFAGATKSSTNSSGSFGVNTSNIVNLATSTQITAETFVRGNSSYSDLLMVKRSSFGPSTDANSTQSVRCCKVSFLIRSYASSSRPSIIPCDVALSVPKVNLVQSILLFIVVQSLYSGQLVAKSRNTIILGATGSASSSSYSQISKLNPGTLGRSSSLTQFWLFPVLAGIVVNSKFLSDFRNRRF